MGAGASAQAVSAARAATLTLLGVVWYQGLTIPLLGVAAPWIATRFGLDASALAKLYSLMSLSALVTFVVARLADRGGRRRLLVVCLCSASLLSVCAALCNSVVTFAICELLRFSMVGAIANSALALHAESAANSGGRAFAVGKVGMAAALGGATLLAVMPLVAHLRHSYRWVYAAAASGVLFVPALLHWVPESARWESARAAGLLRSSTLFGVFERSWLRRALAVVGASLLGGVEGAAVGSWSYYYGVSVVGITPRSMSSWSLAATLVGFAGFRLGVAASERWGRVRTAVCFGFVHQAAALGLYLGPLQRASNPALWVGFALCLSALGASASGTAKSTASLELFPTTLRVTILGWVALAGALATGISNLLVALLARPLGLPHAIALLSLTGVASLVVFGLWVEETRGLGLEQTAPEEGRNARS